MSFRCKEGQTFFPFLKQHHCRKYIVIFANQANEDLCKNFTVGGGFVCLFITKTLGGVCVKQVNGFVMYIRGTRTQTDLLHAPLQTAVGLNPSHVFITHLILVGMSHSN